MDISSLNKTAAGYNFVPLQLIDHMVQEQLFDKGYSALVGQDSSLYLSFLLPRCSSYTGQTVAEYNPTQTETNLSTQ